MDHATERMIEAYVARDSFEGHFLKDLLSDNGIEAQVTDENSAYAGVGGLASPKVWVFEKDQDAARQLLEEYEATRAQSALQPDQSDDVTPGFDADDEITTA